MLYRRMRRRKIIFNTYHRPMPRAQRVVVFLTVCFLILATALSIILIQLRPVMLKLACTEVNKTVTNDINDVIDEEISSGSLDYSNLITQDKDLNGNIAALQTNMPMINLLQARITKNVVNRVSTEIVSDLKIPIGNAIGGALFSGRGPSFTVKILSIANVKTRFVPTTEAAGINQTHYKLMLYVSATIDMFVPGSSNATTTVDTEVQVYDTYIVGKVPDMYAEFGNSGGNS